MFQFIQLYFQFWDVCLLLLYIKTKIKKVGICNEKWTHSGRFFLNQKSNELRYCKGSVKSEAIHLIVIDCMGSRPDRF